MPDLFRAPIPSLAARAYAQAFRALGERVSEIQRTMLVVHYQAPDRVLTPNEMAKAVGHDRHQVANAQYGRLGSAVAQAAGVELPKEFDGAGAGWSALAAWRKTTTGYEWKMHDAVAEALEEVGLVESAAPPAYLLTWNPDRWAWEDLATEVSRVRAGDAVERRWSSGTTTSIKAGARVYLLRQGTQGRGLVGAGRVVRGSYQDAHWDASRGDEAWYVDVAFDTLLDPAKDVLLPPERLGVPPLDVVHWNTPASGIRIDPIAAAALARLWRGWYALQHEDVGSTLLAVFDRYRADGVVFRSPEQRAYYAVASVDDTGASIDRLTANEPARVTASGFVRALRDVLPSGALPVQDLYYTTAVHTAYLQAPSLVLTPERTARAVVTDEDAVQVLLDCVGALNVDRSQSTPKLCKPAVVACVLDGIEDGSITANRIDFDGLVPRVVERLAALGQEAEAQQVAYAYAALASEPFWLLAYANVEVAPSLDPVSPAKLREHVRHARLVAPYWEVLQGAGARARVREALRAAWWPDAGGPGEPDPVDTPLVLDEALLARSVAQTIRPALMDEGRLDDPGAEGYHHQRVLPKTVPLLTRASIEADPIEAVLEALQAHVNLLSQYEQMYAKTFFVEGDFDPDVVRTHVLDLLYGADDLAARVGRFTTWGTMDDREDGAGRDLNATVASYLLAASQPERYAFCKPTIYTPAAKALLGDAVGSGDPAARVAHCTRFYRAVLRLLRDEHGLPVSDLMHVHIAFYVVKNAGKDDGLLGWAALQTLTIAEPRGHVPYRPGRDGGPDPSVRAEIEASVAGRLLLRRKNVVLYGPPGTGKTRETLALKEAWERWQGDDTVEQVTFHPTFAYEDFVEGFRPDPESGQFDLRPGVFVRFCDQARAQPERAYLLLIDEINRGDAARIFGELVTQLEDDKRGPQAARRLPYSQRAFWVPANVHVLGTMNTADRSISLMDVAIRRRFAFVEVGPDAAVFARSAAHLGVVAGVSLAALLRGLNARLQEVGVDRDRALGHSFFLVRADEADPLAVLADRLRYDVVPLVEEYCYADRPLMRQVLGRLVHEDGRLDAALFATPERLVRALHRLCASASTAPVPEASAEAVLGEAAAISEEAAEDDHGS